MNDTSCIYNVKNIFMEALDIVTVATQYCKDITTTTKSKRHRFDRLLLLMTPAEISQF